MMSETTETFEEIATPANPFPGLRPFEFDESHLFFGRDGQSEQLISKLGRARFLAVVGTSGSGKSSLVRAGLLPTLLGGFMTSAGSDWRIAIMRPGSDPVGNLAEALNSGDVFGSEIEENAAIQTAIAEATLRRGSLGLVDAVRQAAMPENESLLVLVDQFEEIFRFARVSEGETYHNDAAAFVKLILEASRQREIPIYVVLTMRSDYLGDCSQFWDLPEAINESQYLIPRLTRDQLREAITGPAAVGLGKITPRLVNRLLNDVGDDQDQLPILQHALMRAWDEWKAKRSEHQAEHKGEAIDLCCYRAIGEMDKALSEHADEAYKDVGHEMGERGQKIAENIFKCLTEKGADSREVRRPLSLGGICAVADAGENEVSAVIETFRAPGRSFLMPPAGVRLAADSLIDISHESLIRNWKRLTAWVGEEARLARIYLRLAETAALNAENREGLLRDPALQIALDWREQNSPNEAWARRYHPGFDQAMNFLQRSQAARETELLETENQRRKELRRTRLFAVVLAVAALFSLGLAGYAMQQKVKAQQSANDAEEHRKSAVVSESKANDFAETLRIKEADARRQKDDAERLKESAVANEAEAERQKGIALANEAEAERQKGIALANEAEANRQRLSAVSYAKEVERQSGISAETFGQFLGLQADRVRRDKDGALDLSALLAVESLGAREAQRTPNEFGDEVLRSAMLLLPRRVARRKIEIEGGTNLAAFNRDGEYLATVGADRSISVWEAASGHLRSQALGSEYQVQAVALSQDAKYLAVADDQNHVRVWRAQSGQLIGKPINPGTQAKIAALKFSPDGSRLVTAAGDTAQMWDAATGNPVGAPMKHDDRITDLAFSGDGRYLATGCASTRTKRDTPFTAAYLWDTSDTGSGLPISRISELDPKRAVTHLALSPDRSYLATAYGNADIQVRNPSTPEKVVSIPALGIVRRLMFSPDDQHRLAVVSGGEVFQTVHLWTIAMPGVGKVKEVARLIHQGPVSALAFSIDGKHLLTAGNDGVTHLWETKSRDEVAMNSSDQLGLVRSIAVSASSKELLTAGDKGLQMWEVESGQPLELALEGLRKGAPMTALALSSDGKHLAAGGEIAAVWDLDTRRMIAKLKAVGIAIKSLAFSPDGKRVAAVDGTGITRVWDLSSGNVAFQLDDHNVSVVGVTFDPNGKFLFTAGFVKDTGSTKAESDQHGVVQVWDAATGKHVEAPLKYGAYVRAVAVSPNGKYLAAASDQGVQVWTIPAFEKFGEELAQDRDRDVSDIAFSREGSLAIAGDHVEVWDLAGRQRLARIPERSATCAFSPDGKYLMTAGHFGTQTWLWRPKEIVEEACTRLGRNLTYQEWQNYMGDRAYRKTCEKLPIDQSFIDQGIVLAEADDLKGAEAVFRSVKEMEPNLKLDPKAEAQWHAEAGRANKSLQRIYSMLDAERKEPMNEEKIKEAIKLYQQIEVSFHSHEFDTEASDTESSGARTMNNICWLGSAYGYPAAVMSACERAVAQRPKEPNYRDSRGLARALTGNIKGAIEDFQYYIDRGNRPEVKEQRLRWIEALRAGKNPFTPEELKTLRLQ
jgi:WD40 repeat protein